MNVRRVVEVALLLALTSCGAMMKLRGAPDQESGKSAVSQGSTRDVERFFARRQQQIDRAEVVERWVPPRVYADPEQAQRLAQLDQAWAKTIGPLAVEITGNGIRIPNQPADVLEAIWEVARSCPKFNGNPRKPYEDGVVSFNREYPVFERKLKEVLAKVPDAARTLGSNDRPPEDVLTALLWCMSQQANLQAAMADFYLPEQPPPEQAEKACGRATYLLESEKVGGGWSDWDVGPGEPVRKRVDCKSFPKRSSADSPALLRQFKEILAGDIVVQETKVALYNRDEGIHRHVLRGANVSTYGRLDFTKNPCGDPKLFCEMGGSKAARAMNETNFALERAEAHRKAADYPGCVAFVKQANDLLAQWEKDHQQFLDNGTWVNGGRYRLRTGVVIDEKALLARFAKLEQTAKDRKLGYCRADK